MIQIESYLPMSGSDMSKGREEGGADSKPVNRQPDEQIVMHPEKPTTFHIRQCSAKYRP